MINLNDTMANSCPFVPISKLDARLFSILVVIAISSFGALPVSINLFGTSLSAILTFGQFFLFVILLIYLKTKKELLYSGLFYITFLSICLVWVIVDGVNQESFLRLSIWIAVYLIVMVCASWVCFMSKSKLIYCLSLIFKALRMSSYVYLLCVFYLILSGARDAATPMLSMFFLAFYLSRYDVFRARITIESIAALFIFLVPLLMGARIVILANLAILLFYVAHRYSLRLVVVYIIFTAVFLFVLWEFSPATIGLNDGDQALKVMGYSINTSGRGYAWSLVSESIAMAPFFGHGTDIPLSLQGVKHWNHPHNDYLRILHRAGIVGLFAYIMFYISIVRSIRRDLAKNAIKEIRQLHGISLVTLVGVGFCMVTDNIITYSYAMYLSAVLLGLSLGSAANRNLIADFYQKKR